MDDEQQRPTSGSRQITTPRRRRRGVGWLRPVLRLPALLLRPALLIRGYLLRGFLSVAALVLAGFAALSLAAVAGPLPDQDPRPAALDRVPAALPPVPVPTGVAAPLPEQPIALPGSAEQSPEEAAQGSAQQPTVQPEAGSGVRQQAYAEWAARMSDVTGIPARALQAYAYAHAVMAEIDPGCNLTWVTLAGIAAIESNHGQYQGRSLNAAGVPSAPIIGIPLTGAGGTAAISDTDGGALDGDPVWDRAVGPFQFIPSTWANWATDADGDGVANPQDIDDAAVAAARYLCAGNRDLSTGEDWLDAVLSYNHSMAYATNVYQAAQRYASMVNGSS